MSWFLYLIECADDSVYTGITTDVAARFDEHACGKGARYTRSRKPRAVLASFPLPDRSIASRAEYWVKRLTAAQKRELAAGIRTLESVLPVGMSIDGSIDADAVHAASRGKKKAAKTVTKKVQSIDVAAPVAKAERPRQKTAKAAKAEKAGNDGTASPSAKTRAAKPGQASPTPTRAKLAAAAQRANIGDAAEAKKTASRSAAAKRKKPATRAAPKRKTPAAGGNPVAQEHGGTIAKPARRRASPGRSTAEAAAAVATPRRATGATRAMDVTRATGTTDAPRATRAKAAPTAAALPAPARPRKNTTARAVPRTKQNRAAS
jgi:putative endonuclease